MKNCHACKVERDQLSPSEAFVMGIMIASLQGAGRLRIEGTLCDRHGRFPHARAAQPTGAAGEKT